MKVRFLLSILPAFLVLVSFCSLKAQSPDQQFGVGTNVSMGGFTGDGFSSVGAITGAYAFTPSIHVGTGLILAFDDDYTTIGIAPYGKFLLKGTKDFVPFILGQLSILKVNMDTPNDKSKRTNASLFIGGGAEYFASKNLGVYGALGIVNVGLNNESSSTFGLFAPTVGIEWFFN